MIEVLIAFGLVYVGYRMGRRSTAPKHWLRVEDTAVTAEWEADKS